MNSALAPSAQALFEGCPVGLAEFDSEARCLHLNPAFAAMSERPATEALGLRLEQILPALSSQKNLIPMAVQTGLSYLDLEVLPKEGDLDKRWIVSAFPVSSPPGEEPRVGVCVRVETSRASERQAARERDFLFRSIFERTAIGMLVIDFGGQGIRINPAILKALGYTEQEFADRGVQGVTHPEDWSSDAALFQQLLAGEIDEYQLDKRYLRKDGSIMWGHLTGSASRDADGKPLLLIASIEDITTRKLAEHERDRLIAELKDAVEARDAFLLVASHELRTPLTPLAIHLDLLHRALEKQAEAIPPQLKQVKRQVRRLSRLVEQLLDASQMASGNLECKCEPFDLAAVAMDIAEQMRPEAEAVGSLLETRIESIVNMEGDHLRIEQVIANLIANAIKFGQGKPIELTVELRPLAARLSVRDQGIGIEKAHHERIFERFERAVSEMGYGGLGLGLYIVREIVRAHGGALSIDSEPGAGSTFTVELPLRAAHKIERPTKIVE